MTTRRGVLLGAIGALGVAACAPDQPVASPTSTPSASPSALPSPTPSPSPSPNSPSPSPTPTSVIRAPLTGLPVDAQPTGPAVALKVPNLERELPQEGLDVADIVFCQPNGDSSTRLCAVYHSEYAERVAPIRSIRPADVPLLAPMRPVFGNTGAAEWVMNYTLAHEEYLEVVTYLQGRKSGRYSVNEDRVYRQDGKRFHDKAIVAHPALLAAQAERLTEPPAAYFPWVADPAEASTAVDGTAATHVAIPYGRGHSYDMSYYFDADSGRYVRFQPFGAHVLADGTPVAADNVLIIQAAWSMDKIWQGSGAADPVLEIVEESGTFIYLNGGSMVSGTWSKGEVQEPFQFTTDAGAPLAMAPGRTWVELPQEDAEILVGLA